MAIHFQDEDVPQYLPSDIALALFRVLEEATVNAVVHSAAHEIWVSVRGTAADIRMQIVDRGVGFDTMCRSERGWVGGDPRAAQTRQRRTARSYRVQARELASKLPFGWMPEHCLADFNECTAAVTTASNY